MLTGRPMRRPGMYKASCVVLWARISANTSNLFLDFTGGIELGGVCGLVERRKNMLIAAYTPRPCRSHLSYRGFYVLHTATFVWFRCVYTVSVE